MENIISDFHLAVKQNDTDKVQQFLKDGINPDEPNWNNNGRPAILEATYQGNIGMVRVLLLQGNANPNVQNMLGETALHNAFHPKTFSKELVGLLLDHGADVNVREKLNGYTPVHIAAKLCVSPNLNKSVRRDVLEVLRAMCKKADIELTSTRKETPLHRLVSAGCTDWTEPLQVLIECGYDLDARNDRGETALVCAIDKGRSAMAELLVKKGAQLNVRDRHQQTALHHAVQKNLQRLAKLLLDAQCDVNAADLNGDTPLHIAASKGLVDMIQVLLSNPKVDVNVQNLRGSTPLLCAVESGFTKVVEKLLDFYLDADSEKCLLMALDMAEENFVKRWHPEILCLLQEALEQRRDLWDEGETSL